jgi:hypothetical protein
MKRLGEEYSLFRQLPEEKQDEIRRLFREFSQLPEDRRSGMRREIFALRQMTPAKRAVRLSSEEFQNDFDDRERTLLKNLLDILPEHAPEPRH